MPRKERFRSNETAVKLTLQERIPPRELSSRILNEFNSHLRIYTLGAAQVIVTREFGKWHLSISCQDRYPTWDEVAEARYQAIPNEATMVMVLPPREEFINLHRYCFQLLEVDPASIQ